MLWQPMTSATLAYEYRKLFEGWAEKTGCKADIIPGVLSNIDIQGHDFSMRGMSGSGSAVLSGVGHAISFKGSDTLPVMVAMKDFYNAEDELIVCSVPATEHSVMCAGGDGEGEFETFKRLITETYPSGIVSIVSDTWDLWKVLTEYLPRLKAEIIARDGKIVIRPDSGDPVDIICGTVSNAKKEGYAPVAKGVVQLLWETFGGTTNELGFKELDSHIGCIYGDAITISRADEMCKRLYEKGFASTNWVAGIGSFTYQYNTRDTFGFAMKATYVEVNDEGREIFKDPITDDGTKKSAKGLMYVQKNDFNGEYELIDQVCETKEEMGELKTLFVDGLFHDEYSLSQIRERLLAH
jgi:nicotinamide phosphoribosyltransferase